MSLSGRALRAAQQTASVVSWVARHPANQGARLWALGRALSWQVSKRTLRAPRRIRTSYGALVECQPASVMASSAIYTRGMPDWHEMKFFERYLRRGDGFIDVGANIGLYALLARSKVGAEGLVLALEPDPATCQMLRRNVTLNGFENVEVAQAAAADSAGTLRFTSGQDAMGRLDIGDGTPGVIEVQAVRLDELVSGRGLAAGKMDIEGAEPLAMAGAESLLEAGNPPVWQLEINSCLHRHGWTAERFTSWLEARDYGTFVYDAHRGLLTQTAPSEAQANVFAIHLPSLPKVERRLGATVSRA